MDLEPAEESSGRSRSWRQSPDAPEHTSTLNTQLSAGMLQDTTVPLDECPRGERALFESLSRREYQGNESLILVGFVGVGKRTLGLIASVALRREYVDFDSLFEQRYGLSPGAYITAHGTQAYRNMEYETTINTIETKRTGCVLVGFFKLPSSREYKLLKEWSKTNPVIHVRRDGNDLPNPWRSQEQKFIHTYKASSTLYGQCANFDFFNITQHHEAGPRAPLKLKQTERDFIRFLHCIFDRGQRLLHSVEPLSASYTYALQVPLRWLEEPGSDLRELDTGADAVSFVLDYADMKDMDTLRCRISKQMSFLKRHTRAPVIFDFDIIADSESQNYWDLFETGLRQAPDMITVSLDINEDPTTALAAARGSCKIIGTICTSEPWSMAWTANSQAYLKKAKALGCHAIRITSRSGSTVDNLACLQSVHAANISSELPVIGYNAGASGRTSICFSPILSPVVLPSMVQNGVTLKQAQKALYSSFITSRKHFTAVGRSIGYSPSPAMHGAAYEACGMSHHYDSMQVPSFAGVQQLLEQRGRAGLAASLPYKTKILPMLNSMTTDACHIGAVNTVVIEQDSKTSHSILTGYNTDYIGIQNCIERNLSPANSIRPKTTALIIGAGGMARAAVYACHKAGISNICVFNRTPANAHSLVEHYNKLPITELGAPLLSLSVLSTLDTPWPPHLCQPTVIVSCIPADEVGLNLPIKFDIPEHWLRSKTGGTFIEVSTHPTSLISKLSVIDSANSWRINP